MKVESKPIVSQKPLNYERVRKYKKPICSNCSLTLGSIFVNFNGQKRIGWICHECEIVFLDKKYSKVFLIKEVA